MTSTPAAIMASKPDPYGTLTVPIFRMDDAKPTGDCPPTASAGVYGLKIDDDQEPFAAKGDILLISRFRNVMPDDRCVIFHEGCNPTLAQFTGRGGWIVQEAGEFGDEFELYPSVIFADGRGADWDLARETIIAIHAVVGVLNRRDGRVVSGLANTART